MAVTRRQVHGARRIVIISRHVSCRRVAKKTGTSTFRSFGSAAQANAFFAAYYSPRAVARRKRQAAATARRNAAAAKHARAAGLKPFPARSAAWWSAYFKKLDTTLVCKTVTKRTVKIVRPVPKKHVKAARARPASRSAVSAKASRARRATRARAAGRRRR